MSDPAATDPLSIILCGADGRMGRAIAGCAQRERTRYRVTAEIRRGDDRAKALDAGEVVIDFSQANVTDEVLTACLSQRKPMVIGTTGQSEGQREFIVRAGREIPVVFAANFSVGVNTLFWLTRQAARILGPGFDLEVMEMHHRLKKDAPSGTARRLAEILAEVRGLTYEQATRHGREGIVGARTGAEIGVHAVRGGDVVGEHTVFFADAGERVELIHRATSRDTFAVGALRAAAWLRDRPPGLYDMEDVLGLR